MKKRLKILTIFRRTDLNRTGSILLSKLSAPHQYPHEEPCNRLGIGHPGGRIIRHKSPAARIFDVNFQNRQGRDIDEYADLGSVFRHSCPKLSVNEFRSLLPFVEM